MQDLRCQPRFPPQLAPPPSLPAATRPCRLPVPRVQGGGEDGRPAQASHVVPGGQGAAATVGCGAGGRRRAAPRCGPWQGCLGSLACSLLLRQRAVYCLCTCAAGRPAAITPLRARAHSKPLLLLCPLQHRLPRRSHKQRQDVQRAAGDVRRRLGRVLRAPQASGWPAGLTAAASARCPGMRCLPQPLCAPMTPAPGGPALLCGCAACTPGHCCLSSGRSAACAPAPELRTACRVCPRPAGCWPWRCTTHATPRASTATSSRVGGRPARTSVCAGGRVSRGGPVTGAQSGSLQRL